MQVLLTDKYVVGRVPEFKRLPKGYEDVLGLLIDWSEDFERLNGFEATPGLTECLKTLDIRFEAENDCN